MSDKIEQTKAFVIRKFDESPYFMEHPENKAYRLEHTMRVANIGEQIARAEGLDIEALVIACMLHDVSYCEFFEGVEAWRDHGRRAAAIARPFLKSLELEPEKIDEICYGIAIHVDDEADFKGEKTPLALSVGDADNLDRFDAYRIFSTLELKAFSKMPLDEKKETVTSTLTKLKKYRLMEFGTKFATKIWRERLDFYIVFYEKLLSQLQSSEYPVHSD